MFETWHREQQHFCSQAGSGEKILYSPEFDRFGVMTLKESGKEDLYAFIQSHKDSVALQKSWTGLTLVILPLCKRCKVCLVISLRCPRPMPGCSIT